jgi:hypothetical protein
MTHTQRETKRHSETQQAKPSQAKSSQVGVLSCSVLYLCGTRLCPCSPLLRTAPTWPLAVPRRLCAQKHHHTTPRHDTTRHSINTAMQHNMRYIIDHLTPPRQDNNCTEKHRHSTYTYTNTDRQTPSQRHHSFPPSSHLWAQTWAPCRSTSASPRRTT